MNAKNQAGAVIAITALWVPCADAAMIIGAPVVVPFDAAVVSVSFESAHAENTGNLYFLGSGDEQGILVSAANSDDTGLGQFLFANHNLIASTGMLEGTYHAGEMLFFAYDVIAPDEATDDLYRCDLASDRNQFAWEVGQHGTTGTLFIEDLHPDEVGYDADFNDMVVAIEFTPVPTPGSAVLMGLGVLMMLSKRRR